jgi:cell division protein FtsZ
MSEFGEFIQEGMDVSIVGGIGEPKVCVVGCGGAGNNVVEGLYWDHPGIETIALNDNQDRLCSISCSSALLIRPEDIDSVEELYGEAIREKLSNSDIVFVVVGLGGTFGSVVAPVVTKVAKEMNLTVLSVGIQPFAEEMRPHCEETLKELRVMSDAVVVIDNNKLTEISEDLTVEEGFKIIQNGISKIITAVCQHITDQIASYLNTDIAEEIRYDLQSMSDVGNEQMPGHAVTGTESAFMQESLFSVEGPFFNFQ